MKKHWLKTPLYWATSSLFAACISTVFFIGFLEVYELLIFGSLLFTIVTIALGLITILQIKKSMSQIIRERKVLRIFGILPLLFILYIALRVETLPLVLIHNYGARRAYTYDRLIEVRELSYLIKDYLQKNKRMPNVDSWFDLLEKRQDGLYYEFPESRECNFALNKNLSESTLDGLDGTLVLLFEADFEGYFAVDDENNLSGGSELIVKKRVKDKYFLFKRQRFIYILFVDGTIAKYRLHDGAVSLYEPERDQAAFYNYDNEPFTDYFKKGQTSYSPLKW